MSLSDGVPRIRMIAGPNGSGKSTVKADLPPELFGIFINPDELEQNIRSKSVLALEPFGIATNTAEVRECFTSSELLRKHGLADAAAVIDVHDGVIDFHGLEMNGYYTSVLSDFLRRKLMDAKVSFGFETVMSHEDKIEFLREAQRRGYRTYLYYIATEDPAINVNHVERRVAEGGHDVPHDKIVARYGRSLGLLRDAIRYTNRAYLFDASDDNPKLFAEITDGIEIEFRAEEIPEWFKTAVYDKLNSTEGPSTDAG